MILVATVVVNLFIAAVLIATPALSRDDTPLGVRVPALYVDHSAVRAAVRAYRTATTVLAGAVVLVGGVAALALDTQRAAVVGLGLLPLVLIGLALLAMARSRRAILDARQAEGWMRGASPGEMADEHLYRWGLFYVNPDDPSLLVEKRFGYGIDINFGHPVGQAIGWLLALLIVGTVGILIWLAITAG